MPAPSNTQSPEKKILDANDVYLETWFVRENNAYTYLSNYTFNGNTMIAHTWTAPSGDTFVFDVVNGDILMNSLAGGTLNASQRVAFFRYLPKFVGECLKNFNQFYGL